MRGDTEGDAEGDAEREPARGAPRYALVAVAAVILPMFSSSVSFGCGTNIRFFVEL